MELQMAAMNPLLPGAKKSIPYVPETSERTLYGLFILH
jgi:hypothetical protein